MKKQAWQGNWRNLLIRLFVGAFLPALATYTALYFLLSLWMNASGASWSALFIAACVWNFCNYLMGHTIPYDGSVEPNISGNKAWSKCYDPYDSFNPSFSPLYRNAQYNITKRFSKW